MTKIVTGVRALRFNPWTRGSLQGLVAALLLGPASAEAAHTVGRPDLEALTGASDTILRARCIS